MLDDPFVEPRESGADRRIWLAAAVVVGAFLILGAAFYAGRRGASSSTLAVATATPISTPTPLTVRAETIVNGVRLYDGDEANWLSFYRANEILLGEPLSGPKIVNGVPGCVVFEYYVICHSDDPIVRGGLWEYVPLALGYATQAGGPAQLDAPLAPIAEEYAQSIRSSGRDVLYWLGRSTSAAFCSDTECVQTFERAVLRWPNRPSAGSADIIRTPLGRRSEG